METTRGVTIEPLLKKIRAYEPQADLDLVRRAFAFAAEAHGGELRASGLPYIAHPVRAAEILADLKVPIPIVVAGLLHDVPEDTSVTLNDIKREFGPDIAGMVGGITKLGKLKYRGIERYVENLRRMFLAMASDVRVVVIKFADRIHNLETLDALKPDKRRRIALESLEIYAPIANRLGLHELRTRIEDLAFRYVQPQEYAWVKDLAERAMGGKAPYIERVRRLVEQDLRAGAVPFISVGGRIKHLYSLYQKLLKHERDIVQIHDLAALRVIVPDVGDCYAALGIIHQRWRPLKNRIKDYIAMPKPNGYRSLHTTVFCEGGEVVEFQIRTVAMHEEAERGIAAHWAYDEAGKRAIPAGRDAELAWVKDLADRDVRGWSNAEFMERLDSLKIDVFHSHIFVFTPHGDVIDLPEGATAVDFAYAIHSRVGDQAVAARVNDSIASLDTKLASGDCCEIITDKNRHGPNPDWLDFVKTGHARGHIKANAKSRLAQWMKDSGEKK